MRRNKDLSSLFELGDQHLQAASAAAVFTAPVDSTDPVGVVGVDARTTLPGGGQKGDATAASFEYGDELEN